MFSRARAANECYNDVELTLPSGREVVGKVPKLRQQLRFLDLVEDIANGSRKARLTLVDEFPKAVGLVNECDELTFEEFFDVVNRFFGRRGSANGGSQPTETMETPPEPKGS